ncbi:uncharacterized protein LOC112564978 isoform X3 [Pomacea canaliculata]|uniref:uncharacterized protein LOC112564978 isoform X3 n=1 Tax=Pomacea canaliculata TaxID=400727 RepID=UPI000D72D0D0|nr:uncharacterized protein LOC112564978 isoform X3 [Pomacea canaliculata]
MESEPGDGNLLHTFVVQKRFPPGLCMDLDAARKSDCGRDPGLKQTMLHGVTGSRGMSRDVDTTNSRTRAKPVPGPDRNFLTRRGRLKLPHISTCRQTVTVPSLAALRVERQKGRELDRFLASFKKNLKPEKEKMQQVTVAGSRASTAVSESNRKESVKSNTPQKCTTKKLWKKAISLVLSVIRVGNQMALWSLARERIARQTCPDTDDAEYELLLRRMLFPKEKVEQEIIKGFTRSKQIQRIMLLPPERRTRKDCYMVVYKLQTIEEFQKLPLHIQIDIVSRGHLMITKSKRILIRDGHEAMNWYFIVCGEGMMRSNVVDSRQKREITILTQGMSLGEAEINSQAPWTCTVISTTPMQLIYLSKMDYLHIFQENLEILPEHVQFLQDLDFMKNWPIELLLKHPTQCTQTYFRKNQLVVKDSNSSKFLYIVRSGECAVYIGVPRTSLSWRDLMLKLIHPMINIEGWPEARTDTGDACQPPGDYLRYRRVSSLSKESADLASMSCLQLSDPDYCTQLSSSRPSHPSVASRQNDWPFDLLSKSSFDKMTARDESSDKGKEKKKKQQVKEEMKGKKGGKPVRLSCPADKCYTVAASAIADVNEKLSLQDTRKFSLPALFKTSSTSTKKRKSSSGSSDYVYLHIDTLKGLSELDLPDMKVCVPAGKPCLVSLGAEVIFLSKRFFLSSCNRLCQEDVFKSRRFYPTQENMQICYRLHMAWKQYTDKVVKELHDDILNEGRQFFGTYFNV